MNQMRHSQQKRLQRDKMMGVADYAAKQKARAREKELTEIILREILSAAADSKQKSETQ